MMIKYTPFFIPVSKKQNIPKASQKHKNVYKIYALNYIPLKYYPKKCIIILNRILMLMLKFSYFIFCCLKSIYCNTACSFTCIMVQTIYYTYKYLEFNFPLYSKKKKKMITYLWLTANNNEYKDTLQCID